MLLLVYVSVLSLGTGGKRGALLLSGRLRVGLEADGDLEGA